MKKHGISKVLVLTIGVIAITFAGISTARADNTIAFAEAYGAAAGSTLYNTQVILGMTADAIAKDVYTNDEAKAIINEQKAVLGLTDDYVAKLLKLVGLDKDDKASLSEISVVIAKINATADALTNYMDNPSDENVDKFQARRQASYAAIAKLLGLDKDNKE